MKNKLELEFDVRVVDRYIREGLLSKEEYEEYLKNLPDITDKGCPLIIDEETEDEHEASTESQEEGSE